MLMTVLKLARKRQKALFRLVRNCARNASFERSRTSKPRSKRRLMERRFSA